MVPLAVVLLAVVVTEALGVGIQTGAPSSCSNRSSCRRAVASRCVGIAVHLAVVVAAAQTVSNQQAAAVFLQ